MPSKNDIGTTDNFYKALEISNRKASEKQLKPFHVYFDQQHNIKCITPVQDAELEKKFNSTIFPFKEVKDFITDVKSLKCYTLVKKKGKQTEYEFKPKILEVNYIRNVDAFLNEVVFNNKEQVHILITNNLKDKTLNFKLDSTLRREFLNGFSYIDEENINVNGQKNINIYFTTKDNPQFLLKTISIGLQKLIANESYSISYKSNLDNVSVFTKKIFDNYSYIEVQDE